MVKGLRMIVRRTPWREWVTRVSRGQAKPLCSLLEQHMACEQRCAAYGSQYPRPQCSVLRQQARFASCSAFRQLTHMYSSVYKGSKKPIVAKYGKPRFREQRIVNYWVSEHFNSVVLFGCKKRIRFARIDGIEGRYREV